jgi:hypothetical protein
MFIVNETNPTISSVRSEMLSLCGSSITDQHFAPDGACWIFSREPAVYKHYVPNRTKIASRADYAP